jgi:hypothetical protein
MAPMPLADGTASAFSRALNRPSAPAMSRPLTKASAGARSATAHRRTPTARATVITGQTTARTRPMRARPAKPRMVPGCCWVAAI